ncbi:MAG: ATP synthase F1 subunit delta [Thermodesulfobacteriota bacterium]|jgi:F-type H+-transporting ATPase subunit delta|nr:MAG: ATP synthase F1 subunit delta [Thermodesulfobacteriota bacterium]
MLNKKIARRYAQALIEIGKENNRIDNFKTELNNFSNLLKKFPEFQDALLSPLYSAEDLKKTILGVAAKIKLSETIKNFLCLLVDKRRIQYFSAILELYEDLTYQISGYVKARVITARPLSTSDLESIKKSLEDITRKKVLLNSVVEPQIIGGVIAEVGDKIFDGSIRNQLQRIGETLI